MITDKMLKAIMPHAPRRVREAELPLLNHAAFNYDITTKKRCAAWLATLAVESGELRYQEELASGAAYEGRKDLGNTQRGDGRRFKGHGRIQGTGRDVHQAYTNYLRKSKHLPFVDFIQHPERLATAPYSTDFAGWFVNGYKHLNDEADAGNFLKYQIGVNGRNKRTGLPNHWIERQNYYRRALAVIPDGWRLESPGALSESDVDAAAVEQADATGFPDYDVVTGEPIQEQENVVVLEPEDVDPAPRTENGLQPQQTQGSSALPTSQPVELTREKPSTFMRWMAGVKTAVGAAIASATAWFGGSELQNTVTNKAIEGATPDLLSRIAVIVIYIAVGIGVGVLLMFIASKFYDKSAERAEERNRHKTQAAADPELQTYEFA